MLRAALLVASLTLGANGFTPSPISRVPALFAPKTAYGSRSMRPSETRAQDSSLKASFFDTLDASKEDARKYRRTVYGTEALWRSHRSSRRFFTAFFQFPRSGVLRGLWLETLVFMGFALACTQFNSAVAAARVAAASGKIAAGWMARAPLLSLPALPLSLLGPSLGLLLGLRTNNAYGRWWEARSLWGGIINTTRDLARRGLVTLRSDPTAAKRFCALVNAFPVALKNSLWDEHTDDMLRDELLALGLDAATVGRILTANHRPMDVTRRLALAAQAGLKAEMENDQGSPEHALERSVIRANQNQNFDGGFCTLANLLGACEKINKTPIPLVYTRHAERFLLLWLLAVPPTLCSAFGGGVGLLSGAGVVFGTGLISILLFGVDELAIQLEEPFGVLPLDAMCKVIEGSVNDMVRVNHEEL